MEWNIALLGQALIVFIFDWQNLNMIISIFNLSHTNTCNGLPTRATPGRQRALQKPMAAGRSSERTESERVTTGFRRGAEREYTMHTERSEIQHTLEAAQGINFVPVHTGTYFTLPRNLFIHFTKEFASYIELKGYLISYIFILKLI